MNHIKSNKRLHLSEESVDTQAVIYTNAKYEYASTNCCRKDMAGNGKLNKF